VSLKSPQTRSALTGKALTEYVKYIIQQHQQQSTANLELVGVGQVGQDGTGNHSKGCYRLLQ